MKLYAIIADVGSEYATYVPVKISTDLEKIKEIYKNKKNRSYSYYNDPKGKCTYIGYVELDDSVISCTNKYEGYPEHWLRINNYETE